MEIKNEKFDLISFGVSSPQLAARFVLCGWYFDTPLLAAGSFSLFSEVMGTTIEKYYLAQKIEKVKELLVYDDLILTDIAYKFHYSSVVHLSN